MDAKSQEKSNNTSTHRSVPNSDDSQAILAEQFGMSIYPNLNGLRVSKERYKQISYAFAKRHMVIPIEDKGNLVVVATADPLNLAPFEELRFLLGCDVEAAYSPRDVIMSAIHDCYNTEDGAASQLIADLVDKKDDRGDGEIEVFDLLDNTRNQSPIVQLLNLIITEAIQQGASDIHFEPSENGMKVRYRIDGVLQNRHAPALEYQNQMLTRIKVMSKLDIAEHRLPQDGRIKLRMGRREIDFRVSTVPIAGGERIVMRILDKGNVILGLDTIGMLPPVLEHFKHLTGLPEGIVLVTGPTGSGKTTTLYSAICGMANDEINIMTIEDPVEYNLKGIAQISVHHKIKLDFATGLRHILRQDPDVIMIGEIRDKETAEIAIQAALTGHLVLSTLHTNDAPSAITRLVDMGIEPYLLSSCVVGVLAQRLVRRICPQCKEAYVPTARELQSLGIDLDDLENGCLYKGKGCSHCYNTGFKGRQGVYELMPITNAVTKQIVHSPDAIEMRKLALSQGMVSLLGHGAELVKNGLTTVAEVLRVARGIEEQG
ncbi:MAG: type II/IV secretion system protein [Parachlamydiaceae bacterium]|nr:type II/IV secretion system protein [Parachlamydiaceae bacterium]